VVVEGPVDGHG